MSAELHSSPMAARTPLSQDDCLAAHGLTKATVRRLARAFIAGLPEPERLLICEGLGRTAGTRPSGVIASPVMASYHYRAGRLGLVHKRERLPADYARTLLGSWIERTLGIAIMAANTAAIFEVLAEVGAEGRIAMPTGASQVDLRLPEAELARRRQVLAARNFNARWEPGRIIGVPHEGQLLGVLLDRKLPGAGERWQGFMGASEADCACAHDVLLEPTDEPFEPLFGVIQAWNQVSLAPVAHEVARVQGEIPAMRLAAIRAVHDEYVNGTALAIEPEPGRIALRGVAGGHFTVLSGTPLGKDDLREPYQQSCRDAAARLTTSASASSLVAPATNALHAPTGGMLARLRRWFAAVARSLWRAFDQ